MEVVPLSLELCRRVHLVGHDPRDGLLDVLHPLEHLLVAHVVDILDEMVVLLPESHLDCRSENFSCNKSGQTPRRQIKITNGGDHTIKLCLESSGLDPSQNECSSLTSVSQSSCGSDVPLFRPPVVPGISPSSSPVPQVATRGRVRSEE